MSAREIIPHTADIRLRVEAGTLEELFQEALRGMADIIKKRIADDALRITQRIRIQSPDKTSLLIDFLSEALTRSQIEKSVFYDVKVGELADTRLDAEITGAKVDAFDEDIKAVTYHEAEVQKNEKGSYETVIVFDI